MTEWVQDQSLAYDNACEIITDRMGIIPSEIAKEKNKIGPKDNIIERLIQERMTLYLERKNANN